jgi:hypothetical protein
VFIVTKKTLGETMAISLVNLMLDAPGQGAGEL